MPSPVEKLYKFAKLEAQRGYDNRAVVGGMERIVPNWENEAHAAQLDSALIDQVKSLLLDYPNLATSERAANIQELLNILAAYIQENPVESQNREPSTFTPNNEIPADTPLKKGTSSSASSQVSHHQNHPSHPIQPKTNTNQSLGINAPLTVIPGIGSSHAHALDSLGLQTLADLLYFFPRRYIDYNHLKPINRLEYGEELTIIGTIQSVTNRPIRGGHTQITEAVITDGTDFLRLNWFNQPWITNQLRTGSQVSLSGKVDMYLGRLVMNNPEWEALDQQHLHTSRITPVYPLTANITQRWLRRIMFQTISYWAPRQPDYLPENIRQEAGLLDLPTALYQTHFPDTNDLLHQGQSRLAFDEIFLLQMGVLRQKKTWQSYSAQIFQVAPEWLDNEVQHLPFALTGAQHHVLQDLVKDLSSGRPMNRLLQGDVGSGKTVVAALAAAIVIQNHAQAAIMAPTSILADQHYRNLLRLLAGDFPDRESLLKPEEIRLLVGATREVEKKEIRQGLEDGSIRLVIGTHALIEEPIIFNQLRMVVIDEQHRFGVAQRAALRSKGTNPHLLVMTATPIPRSLALTVYGDLDLSVMDEMPAGRQPVETHVITPNERERAYQLIRSQITLGRQAFIIYPLIEKGEKDEVKAAVEEHLFLQSKIFPDLKLGLLHGRLRSEEKDQILTGFRDGDYNILVSTSVVEVGVDIPNVSVMVIEGANRFGLAQLHQFRGRVGRSQEKSYCLLVPDTEDAVENERLRIMESTNDGFVLAEADLQQRGPGDFLGTRQAGFAELKMANLSDVHLIEKARHYAQAIFEIDPELTDTSHAQLALMVTRFWENGRGEIS